MQAQCYKPGPANKFSTSKPHMSHLTLPRPRLELQDNGLFPPRELGPCLLLPGKLFCTRDFAAALFIFLCTPVLFREKTLHISASSVRNFLFTGNPVVLGKSFVTVWKYNYSLKNILCRRDHPVFSLRKTDPVQHRFSFSQEICEVGPWSTVLDHAPRLFALCHPAGDDNDHFPGVELPFPPPC